MGGGHGGPMHEPPNVMASRRLEMRFLAEILSTSKRVAAELRSHLLASHFLVNRLTFGIPSSSHG